MYDLLFVDDDLDTAKEYGDLVANFTKLRPFVCATKKEAVEAVRKYQIPIAVLDQRMPEISGTDLFTLLRVENPRLRAIMLSGEARPKDIAQAVNLAYSKYLHKTEFRKLPSVVLKEFVKYHSELAKQQGFQREYLFSVRKAFGLRGSVEFWLEAIFVEDENFIDDNSWKLIDQINAGEKRTITEKLEIVDELKFENNIESEISSNAELASKAALSISAKLSSTLKAKMTETHVLKNTISKENKREFSLPQEPATPGELHILSRSFYWTPVFRKIQCHIVKIIRPFDERKAIVLQTLQPTGRVATRQREILSDGSVRETLTGTHLI